MISKIAVKRPVTTFMVILIAVSFGILSILNLKMDLMPNMNMPYAIVITTYSGAGSEEIEKLVTTPIEGAMGTVNGIKDLMSMSSDGTSVVGIEFETSVDIDNAALDMREKIDLIKGVLPDGADTPMVMKFDINAMTPITISISSEKEDLVSLKRIVEDKIINRIERQEGVASVSLSGGKEKEIQVILNLEKLRGYGITESQIQQLLVSENSTASAGSIKQGFENLPIRVTGEFKSIEEISNLPITTPRGSTIYLRDVASVEENYQENTSVSYMNGIPSITLQIQKSSTANMVNVSNSIMKEFKRIEKEMPGITIKTIMDPADYIKMSLSNVGESAVLGGILAVIILYIFLRNVRSTLVVGIAMPVSIVTTFALMYFSNISLNMMSLGGLALGVGMLVDNSIVVLESIYRKLEEGDDRITAAIEGAREVAMPVVASTLTTVAVFLPITFAGGLIAQIFNELSLTISFSLFSSLFVALTFVPMASSIFLTPECVNNFHYTENFFTKFMDFLGKIINKTEIIYGKLLEISLKYKKRTIGISFLFVILTLCTLPIVGVEFMPESDEGSISVNVALPAGTVIEETEVIVGQVLDIIKDDKDIVDISYSITGGGGATAVFSEGSSNRGSITINLTEKNKRDRSAKDIAHEMNLKVKDVPGAEITVSAASNSMGSYGGAGVNVDIKGEDLDTLTEIANDFTAMYRTIPNVTKAESSVEDATPQATIRVNREKCANLGISSASISSIVRTAVIGNVVTTYKIDGKEFDIRIMQSKDNVDYLNDLQNILVPSAAGIYIPLSELADIVVEKIPISINKTNGEKYVSVTADFYGTDIGTVNSAFEEKLNEYIMPEGYRWEYSGSAQQMDESFTSLSYALLLSILLLYMIMAAQFESLIYPFIVMFSIPIAMTGGIFGLFVMNRALSITGFLGLIMLAGVVVNNAIVLVDYINLLIRERNMNYIEAVKIAGPVRLRPILMSTLTTVLGLLPMMFSNGEGAESMHGLSTVVVFGLVLSTLITLILIPVIYSTFFVAKERRTAKKLAKKQKREEKILKIKEAKKLQNS